MLRISCALIVVLLSSRANAIEPETVIERFEQFVAVTWSPDDHFLAATSVGNPGSVLVYDTKKLESIRLNVNPISLLAVDFSPDSRNLAVVDQNGILHIFKYEKDKQSLKYVDDDGASQVFKFEIGKWKSKQSTMVGAIKVKYLPGGKKILASFYEGGGSIIIQLDTEALKEISKKTGNYTTLDVFLSPNGSRICQSTLRAIRVFDATDFKPVYTIPAGLGTLAISPDGKIAATSYQMRFISGMENEPGVTKIWDFESGENIHAISKKGEVVGSPDFSFNSKWIAYPSNETVNVIDLKSKKTIHRLKHGKGLAGIAFAHQSLRIAGISKDGKIKIWDLTPELENAPLWPVQKTPPKAPGDSLEKGQECKDSKVHESRSEKVLARPGNATKLWRFHLRNRAKYVKILA